MSNINKYLANILAARYGKDVRQSIHDAIKEIDSVADTAQNSATAMANKASNHEAAAKSYMESAKASAESAKANAEFVMASTPEGYAEIVSKVELMDIAESTNYTLRNSKPGGYRLLELVGTTKQKQNSGKNFLNAPSTLTVTSENNYSVEVNMLPGEYIISADEIVSTYAEGVALEFITASGLKNVFFKLSNKKLNFSITAYATNINIRVPFYDDGKTSYSGTVTFTNLMIRKADIADATYEEFTNGESIPNPSNPQPIENVGDCVEMMQGKYNHASSGVYAVDSLSICTKNAIPCKPSDVVKLKFEKPLYARMVYFNGKNYVDSVASTYALTEHTFTIPSGVTHFHYNVVDTVQLPLETVGKITLTVNGKYVVQIVERGKNLFDISKSTNLTKISDDEIRMNAIDTTIYEHYFKENTQYTFSAYVKNALNDGSTSLGNLRIRIRYTDGSYDDALMNNTTEYKYLTFTSDAGKTISRVTGYFGNGGYLYLKDFQIEEGSVATPYEPYRECIATIFLDEPLREGDRLVKIDGVWNVERCIKEVVFDGSDDESYTRYENSIGVVSYLNHSYISDSKKYPGNALYGICNQVPNTNGVLSKAYIIQASDDKGVQFYDLINTWGLTDDTVSGFKAMLASNPVVIEYELATPTLTPLDTESQLALNGLVTFDGVTYLEVDSKIKPSGIKGEYGTSQVGAYTLKSLLNSESNALKIEDAINTMLLITP